MRILVLTDSFLPKIGGAEVAIHHLAEGLMKNGHDVMVGCIASENHPSEHQRSYELIRYHMPRGSDRFLIVDWLLALYITNTVFKWKPDFILANFAWPTGFAAIKLKAVHNKPVLVISHGADIQIAPSVNYGLRLNPVLNNRIEWTIKNADGLIAISEQIEQEYINIGALPERIQKIPNGIDYEQLTIPFPNAREILNISASTPVVLSVGRNHPKKGFDKLLHLVNWVQQKIPSVLFLIVGKDVSRLEDLVKQLGIQKNVKLYEQVPPVGVNFPDLSSNPLNNILTFYKAADLFVLPSAIEGLPLVGIEALACGLPILAFQAPGSCDLIKEGENGCLVKSNDWEQFANKIVDLFVSKDIRAFMRVNAEVSAREYDNREVARKIVNFFYELQQIGPLR